MSIVIRKNIAKQKREILHIFERSGINKEKEKSYGKNYN